MTKKQATEGGKGHEPVKAHDTDGAEQQPRLEAREERTSSVPDTTYDHVIEEAVKDIHG